MKISNKHTNVQNVSFSDFSGGLNTTKAPETIAENELAQSVNLEISQGQLRTCAGTDELFKDETKQFINIMYDHIGDVFILIDSDHNVYSLTHGEYSLVRLGKLTGDSDVQYAAWENGILIASGGRLQYYHNGNLDTIAGSFSQDSTNWSKAMPTDWVADNKYIVGDVVVYDEKYYVCKSEHTSASDFSVDSWSEKTLAAWKFATFYEKYSLVESEENIYVAKNTHISISDAPTVCHGVFIKSGRVWVYCDDELHASAVGDENNWTNISNDSSSSQWLQIGYKDGGYITGVCALSSDILIFKSNHYAYHLAGDFPNWTLSEIGRQIDCKDYNDCVSLANASLVLGKTMVQAIATTEAYGDMRAQEISAKISYDIADMGSVKVRYIPSLNQVWFISGESTFLFLDLNNNGFFRRAYTSPLMDAVEAQGNIYLVKNNGVYVLNSDHMRDERAGLRWKFQTKTLVAANAYLIKRVRVDVTPYYRNYALARFKVGDVVADISIPNNLYIYQDYSVVYGNKRSLKNKKRKSMWLNSDYIYDNDEYIYQNPEPIYHTGMYRTDIRCVNRKQAIKAYAHGSGGMTIFNAVSFEIAEV